jgi:hypothetical protein
MDGQRERFVFAFIDQIGKELGVDFILEGSVRRAGDRVRIATQLIQVSDQSHLWPEVYNRTLEDIDMDPNFALARSFAGLAYAQKGMFGEAIVEFKRARRMRQIILRLLQVFP